MKIAIGAVVLCKILISDPSSTTITKEVTELGGVAKNTNVSSNNNFITGKNSVQQTTAVQEVKEVKAGKQYSSIIVGTVEDIRSVQVLKPIENSKKYKYEDQNILILKTEELEKLIVNANACGLADDLIVDESKKEEKKEDIKEVVKTEEPKKVKTKKTKNKKNNNPVKSNTEEYEIIFADQTVPEGYEEVKDDKLQKEISNQIEEKANNLQKNADEIYLEELEKAQEKQRNIVKQEEIKTDNKETPIEEKTVQLEKVEEIKQDSNLNKAIVDDDDLDVVKLLEEQKLKELESNKKEVVKEIAKEVQPSKKNVQITKVKKIEQKQEKPKDKITPDNFQPSGSMMKDVLDIISN